MSGGREERALDTIEVGFNPVQVLSMVWAGLSSEAAGCTGTGQTNTITERGAPIPPLCGRHILGRGHAAFFASPAQNLPGHAYLTGSATLPAFETFCRASMCGHKTAAAGTGPRSTTPRVVGTWPSAGNGGGAREAAKRKHPDSMTRGSTNNVRSGRPWTA